jgi:hypothetical protein
MVEQETKQELIAAAKGLEPPEVFSLKPRTFDEAFRFANLIAESTLIPKEFQKSPANVLIAVQLGMELGVSPMQALQNMYVVNGRPAIFGDLLPAIVMQSGLLEEFEETANDKSATCTVKRKGLKAISRTFTMAEAEGAGLTARNPTYKAFPQRMLQMRARSWALRDMFPDVLKGVAIKEEIEDLPAEPRDVTPPVKMPTAIGEKKNDKRKVDGDTEGYKPGNLRSEQTIGDVDPRALQGSTQPPSTLQASTEPPTKHEEAKKQKVETQEQTAEQQQKDLISECLLWIENASDEEIAADSNWLTEALKRVKGTQNQVAILKPFNARRQALAKR